VLVMLSNGICSGPPDCAAHLARLSPAYARPDRASVRAQTHTPDAREPKIGQDDLKGRKMGEVGGGGGGFVVSAVWSNVSDGVFGDGGGGGCGARERGGLGHLLVANEKSAGDRPHQMGPAEMLATCAGFKASETRYDE